MSARRSMKRNPKSSPSARGARRSKSKYLLEGLETRVLFNTVITDTDPLTPTPADAVFEYKDARGQNVRIKVHGDVSAEFAFAKIGKDGSMVVRDAVGTTKIDKDG